MIRHERGKDWHNIKAKLGPIGHGNLHRHVKDGILAVK
jgi:hypothetical protein